LQWRTASVSPLDAPTNLPSVISPTSAPHRGDPPRLGDKVVRTLAAAYLDRAKAAGGVNRTTGAQWLREALAAGGVPPERIEADYRRWSSSRRLFEPEGHGRNGATPMSDEHDARTAKAAAMEFLQAALAGNPAPATEVSRMARERGLTLKAVRMGREALRVGCCRVRAPWPWQAVIQDCHARSRPSWAGGLINDDASPAISKVKCLGCNTHQTVALDVVRRRSCVTGVRGSWLTSGHRKGSPPRRAFTNLWRTKTSTARRVASNSN
jgi:hypothetical protein